MRSLFEIVQVEPRVFNDFIEDSEYEFDRVNEILKDPSDIEPTTSRLVA